MFCYSKHGLDFLGQIGDLDNHFLFQSPRLSKRSVHAGLGKQSHPEMWNVFGPAHNKNPAPVSQPRRIFWHRFRPLFVQSNNAAFVQKRQKLTFFPPCMSVMLSVAFFPLKIYRYVLINDQYLVWLSPRVLNSDGVSFITYSTISRHIATYRDIVLEYVLAYN